MADLAAADRNYASFWTHLVERGGGRRSEIGEALVLTSGVPVSLFNLAFASASIDDCGGLVSAVATHFATAEVPYNLVFRDEVSPGLAEACEKAGLVEHWRMPLMTQDPLPFAPSDTPSGLEVVVVDGDTQSDYDRVLADGFGMPLELVGTTMGDALHGMPGYTAILGRAAGTSVSVAGVLVEGGLAGVYCVATPAEHRGQGFGAAVTAAAVEHGRRLGATWAVLQASEAGAPVYRRLGFSTPSHYRQFSPR